MPRGKKPIVLNEMFCRRDEGDRRYSVALASYAKAFERSDADRCDRPSLNFQDVK
jgi:hypothetical protein